MDWQAFWRGFRGPNPNARADRVRGAIIGAALALLWLWLR